MASGAGYYRSNSTAFRHGRNGVFCSAQGWRAREATRFDASESVRGCATGRVVFVPSLDDTLRGRERAASTGYHGFMYTCVSVYDFAGRRRRSSRGFLRVKDVSLEP